MGDIEGERNEGRPETDRPMDGRGPVNEPSGLTGRPEGPSGAGVGRPWSGDQRRDGGRRRRGRRGRGGRGPGPAAGPGQPLRAPSGEEDEGSAQAREVGAYERRQRQQQERGWRPGGPARAPFGSGRPGGWRPQVGARPMGGRPIGRPAQRYQDMVRRTTAAPRVVGPREAGEPVAGPHAVLEALRAGRVLRHIYIAQERGVRSGAVNDLLREAQERRVPVRFVDRMEIQRMSPGVEHQGVVAIAEGRAGVELEELLLHLDTTTEPPLVLVIDSLQDPQNFGVLLRSAEGAGADGVVIPRHRQVGLTPAVAKTSAGASEHLLIAEVANLRQAIDALKEKGIWVVGTDDSSDVEWDAVDYRGPTAIVIGGEGEGIRRLVLEGCDEVVRIPMRGQVSSLNAAAAGTVVLFEAVRQRMRDAEAAGPAGEAGAVAEPEVERAEDVAADEQHAPEELPLDEGVPAGDDVHGDDSEPADLPAVAEPEDGKAAAPQEAPRPKRAAKRTTTKATAKPSTRKRASG